MTILAQLSRFLIRRGARPWDKQLIAIALLLCLQLLAVLTGTLMAPQVWLQAFRGDSFALSIIGMWSAPVALSCGLRALRTSTNSVLWWIAYVMLGAALLYLFLLTFGAYMIGVAIQEDGLIT